MGHIVIMFILQGVLVPLDSERQWRSFFPGDLWLGTSAGLLVFAAGLMPEFPRDRWWQSPVWHITVLSVTFAVALAVTWFIDAPSMPMSALFSPGKLYHNFILYCGYAYVTIVSLVAAMCGNWFGSRLLVVALALLMVVPWVRIVTNENESTPEQRMMKQVYSHPASYKLFGIIPIRGSYNSP